MKTRTNSITFALTNYNDVVALVGAEHFQILDTLLMDSSCVTERIRMEVCVSILRRGNTAINGRANHDRPSTWPDFYTASVKEVGRTDRNTTKGVNGKSHFPILTYCIALLAYTQVGSWLVTSVTRVRIVDKSLYYIRGGRWTVVFLVLRRVGA